MILLPLPLTREIVLIGGGHCHALVLRMWAMKPLAGVRLTVINPHPTAPYTGMLPGFVAGHYSREALDIDLVRLARVAGARLILDRAVAIDPVAQTVSLAGGRVIPYHTASVDIGITSDLPALPGFGENAIPAKPLDRFATAWDAYLAAASDAANVVVIGGGVGGVELALAMRHGLAQKGHPSAPVTLIEKRNLLFEQSKSLTKALKSALKSNAITVLENVEITAITHDTVVLASGQSIAANLVIGAAGARPQAWLKDSGLDLNDGFIAVDATLRSITHSDVFAVGDCAHLTFAPRPKAGVFAVREAPVLFANLRAAVSGGSMQAFRPQKDYLKLISLGQKSALADKWGLRSSGAALWRLKDRIDQKFMDQFHDLKPMAPPDLPTQVADGMTEALGSRPLCGGCGAKLGGGVLGSVLNCLPLTERTDVLSRPGDDAAILKGPGGSTQVITTDHLRAFTQDPFTMARIAAIHALGDIWAMGGKPQSALATIILPRLGPDLQAEWLREIMSAASEVFGAEGAAVVGGHTSIGAELTIGFTVTGLCDAAPITLAGARPGDRLILTKPIGSGTIMAAEMALEARGDWVASAWKAMTRPQGDAAAVLAGAHAMTDVTGFGLAGHLLGMARASGVEISIDLNAVPFLDGALELAAAGMRSSLFADNRALVPELPVEGNPKAALLFDPQTAGGLVAAVGAGDVGNIICNLNSLGYEAYVIGACREGQSTVSLGDT
ncbi:MAG: selenide, water dikinase SelD [Marinosulfonomonas sp.]|nr:selenide, water dikinase SelD [Marinosulfonomonas sp.]